MESDDDSIDEKMLDSSTVCDYILNNSLMTDSLMNNSIPKVVDIDIMNISILDKSIVKNTNVESVVILPKKHIKRKRFYSQVDRSIEVTLKNLLGDKCKVIGKKNSLFYEFLYKLS